MTPPPAVRLRELALASPVGATLRKARRRLRRLARPDQNRLDNLHLRAIMAATLDPTSNCVDVGAHAGEMLSHIVRLSPQGRHFAFEPLPDFAARLRSDFPTVEVHEIALSNHDRESNFVHVVTRPGFSGFRERRYPRTEQLEQIEVKVMRLDDVLPADYAPDFIKIDVEGAELEVLLGAVRTIARHRPLVAFEHGLGGADHYGTRPEEVYGLLVDRLHLRIFDLEGEGQYTLNAFVTAFDQHRRVNFFARP